MNLEAGIRQGQVQAQVQTMSLQMQHSLRMLAMSLPELRASLYEELSKNPVIEGIESTLENATTTQKECESEASACEAEDPYDTDMDDHAEIGRAHV